MRHSRYVQVVRLSADLLRRTACPLGSPQGILAAIRPDVAPYMTLRSYGQKHFPFAGRSQKAKSWVTNLKSAFLLMAGADSCNSLRDSARWWKMGTVSVSPVEKQWPQALKITLGISENSDSGLESRLKWYQYGWLLVSLTRTLTSTLA